MTGEGRQSEIFAPGLLEGRVALITGGGTGLGFATALELVRCGASVVICGRRAEVLEGAAAQLAELGGVQAADCWVAGDVREREQAAGIVGAALDRHGRMDILV